MAANGTNSSDDSLLEEILIDLIDFDWAHDAFDSKTYIDNFAEEHDITVEDAALLVDSAIYAIATDDEVEDDDSQTT